MYLHCLKKLAFLLIGLISTKHKLAIVCDRIAATIKGDISRYANEGNNYETSTEFVQVVMSTSYVTIDASKMICTTMIEQKVQWSVIKQFSNIQYEKRQNLSTYGSSIGATFNIQATVWRAFGISIRKQRQLQQKLINADPIEVIAEQNNNEWKREGNPYYRKSMYQIFFRLHSQNKL